MKEAEEKAKDLNIHFIETSAKTGFNVNEVSIFCLYIFFSIKCFKNKKTEPVIELSLIKPSRYGVEKLYSTARRRLTKRSYTSFREY